MKIGIYLGYAPAKNMSMKQEGLGRYLAYIMKGLVESNNEVVVACPKWLVPAIEELCDEHDINENAFRIMTSHNDSAVFRIYWHFHNLEPSKKKMRKKKKQMLIHIVDSITDYILNISSAVLFVFLLLLVLLAGLVILPFLLVLSILYVIFKGIGKILHIKEVCNVLRPKSIFNFLLNHRSILKHIYIKYFVNREFLIQVREKAANDIIRQITKMKDKADVWYCPMAFWPEFNKIPGKRVVCAPDIVTSNFAVNFSTSVYGDVSIQTEEVRRTLLNGEYFITYCEFIKKDLLINQLNKKAENVIAIPHAINDMSSAICIDKGYESRICGADTETILARKILATIKKNVLDESAYMSKNGRGFSFDDVEYIFYASQVRGNKNFLTLIKAYEYLLRKKKIKIKLFLTGNIKNDSQIYNYVQQNQLQHDVVSFTRVSNQQLGALYKCAKLIVNPTLYEGGFNFTFGEGMSVGTPSIMGNIPQVQEVIDGYGLEKYFYDPYDYLDMAQKIEYGLNHLQEIYQFELKLYRDLSKRTWSDVGREYVQAFKYFIEKDRRDKANE